ncbi:MAG: MarR family transcriptional regulator [Gammaproteobacteria bacterium]
MTKPDPDGETTDSRQECPQERSVADARDEVSPALSPGLLADSIAFFVARTHSRLHQAWSAGNIDAMPRGTYDVLALVGANPGVSPGELARFLFLDKSSVSELLERLDSAGLVSRKRSDTDRRRLGVYLTPAGVGQLAALTREAQRLEQRWSASITTLERRQLIELLARLLPEDAGGR